LNLNQFRKSRNLFIKGKSISALTGRRFPFGPLAKAAQLSRARARSPARDHGPTHARAAFFLSRSLAA
jgi:hypothetical protein